MDQQPYCGVCGVGLPLAGNNIGSANICYACAHPTTDDEESSGPNPCVCGRREQCTYWESPCPYRFADPDDGSDQRPHGDRWP